MVETGESTNDTIVSFSKFCGNQDFSYNADDITEPSIIYSDLGRVYMVGDEVSFTYDSFDLFDRNCTITVKAEHNGKVLSTGRNNKCSFVITEFGKFTITLKAVDKTGNETSLSFNVYCYDNVAPTISMTDIVPKTFKVNETVALPQATVTDNIDKNLSYSIYARRSTGSFVIITDELFTPDVKGKWTIYYYASDSCGNYTLTSFDVIVS